MQQYIQTCPLDINYSSSTDLQKIFSEKITKKILKRKLTLGWFKTKQQVMETIGPKIYITTKDHFIITPSSDLLAIKNNGEFLVQLSKYNSDDINRDIVKIAQAISTKHDCGYSYILKNPHDNYVRWYKIGETQRDSQIRENEWGYDLKWAKLSSCGKKIERLLYKYLNFAHSKRIGIDGKISYEIDWFYLHYDLLTKIINAVFHVYDPYSYYFETFNIKSIHDLTRNKIRKEYHKLALKYHPDKVQGDNEKVKSESIFKALVAQYNKLLEFVSKKDAKPDESLPDINKTNVCKKNQKNHRGPCDRNIFEQVITKQVKKEVLRIIKDMQNVQNFRMEERKFLFTIIIELYRIDKLGQIQSLPKQSAIKRMIKYYNKPMQYFHLQKRTDLFNSILAYVV